MNEWLSKDGGIKSRLDTENSLQRGETMVTTKAPMSAIIVNAPPTYAERSVPLDPLGAGEGDPPLPVVAAVGVAVVGVLNEWDCERDGELTGAPEEGEATLVLLLTPTDRLLETVGADVIVETALEEMAVTEEMPGGGAVP